MGQSPMGWGNKGGHRVNKGGHEVNKGGLYNDGHRDSWRTLPQLGIVEILK